MSEAKNPAEAGATEQHSAAEDAPPARPGRAPRGSRLRRLGLWLFGQLAGGLVRALGATWRLEVLGSDPRDADRPGSESPAHLAALFHESMIPSAWLYRDRGYRVAVSRSRDGDLIRATLLALGYAEPPRGSSSRGGSVALRGLLRGLSAGTTGAVLVDGPRGPARVAKTGIVALARRTAMPIQPIAFSARPAIRLASWDHSLVPLPFARIVCAYGEPISVSQTSDEDADDQATARRLDESLAALHYRVDRRLLPD